MFENINKYTRLYLFSSCWSFLTILICRWCKRSFFNRFPFRPFRWLKCDAMISHPVRITGWFCIRTRTTRLKVLFYGSGFVATCATVTGTYVIIFIMSLLETNSHVTTNEPTQYDICSECVLFSVRLTAFCSSSSNCSERTARVLYAGTRLRRRAIAREDRLRLAGILTGTVVIITGRRRISRRYSSISELSTASLNVILWWIFNKHSLMQKTFTEIVF